MGRTAAELLKDLFATRLQVELERLPDAVARQYDELAERDLTDSVIRVDETTRMFVDAYDRILSNVRDQLEISAEAIGIRTEVDGDHFVALFASEAEGVRRQLRHERDKAVLNAHAEWRSKDQYDRKSANVLALAQANVTLHLAALVGPSREQHAYDEDTWKRIVRVVEGEVASAAHDIEQAIKREVRSLGRRQPPPREAYDRTYIAGMYMKAMRKRVDFIFSCYPAAITKLHIEIVPSSLLSLVRIHVESLVSAAINDYRALVVAEFGQFNYDVPEEVIQQAGEAAQWSAVAKIETLIVELSERSSSGHAGRGLRVSDSSAARAGFVAANKGHSSAQAREREVSLETPSNDGTNHERGSITTKSLVKVLGLVLAAAITIGVYWFEKVNIDRREDARHQREQARRDLVTQLGPKLDRALVSADSLLSVLPPAVRVFRQSAEAESRYRQFNRSVNSLDSARIATEASVEFAFDASVVQGFRRVKRDFAVADTLLRQFLDGKSAFYTPIDSNGHPLSVRRTPVLSPEEALDSAGKILFRLHEKRVPGFQNRMAYFKSE